MSIAKTTFEILDWDERPYDETGPKLVRCKVKCRYTGDFDGESSAESLMVYGTDGSASYVGLERFTGTIGGRRGSVVLRQVGTFSDGVAHTTWQVLPGSGTDALAGLTGEGGYDASEGRTVPGATLEYTFGEVTT